VNRLAGETSPYLRQHRDNPVDWYPWGDEAFAAARERDVPVLLSVGYSACHWCHVMAHESFEDPDVAASMNAKFVNVKVDREERPDVDAVYMDAVQALTGRGGWPMTVALDPDGRPFWGGTYLPRDNFLQLLDALDDVWRTRRDDLEHNATALVQAIGAGAATEPLDAVPPIGVVDRALQHIAEAFDPDWGGFGQAPKFPNTHHLDLVLRAYMTNQGEGARQVVTTSLDAMASGGIYDHVGGGFARYSVDREWRVPHFEKMLYDQALLVTTYRQAASVLGAQHYHQVVEETIGYVLRELRHPDGGFYSSEDADSPDDLGHGVEGLYHTWTPSEVRDALSGLDDDTVEATLDWYDITEAGNFEHRSIPNRIAHRGELVRPSRIEAARQRLLAARSRRRRPGLDDKVLTEWNALFLFALADAAATFRRDDWAAAAVANGEFLLRELRGADGRWSRSWQADGRPQARHTALAADHSALIAAFIRLAELTGRARWIAAACETAETLLDRFWDPVQGGLYSTADDAEALVVRQKDLLDGATPSANSSAALGLMRLAALTGEQRYANHADRILQLLGAVIEQTRGGASNALLALELRHRGLIELAVVGDAPGLVEVAHVLWRPDLVLAWGEPYDSPLWQDRRPGWAYLCRDHVCEAPVDTPEALYEQIAGRPLPTGAVLDLSTPAWISASSTATNRLDE
jgi:uncharacterized protein YyaL (SSP411 family)